MKTDEMTKFVNAVLDNKNVDAQKLLEQALKKKVAKRLANVLSIEKGHKRHRLEISFLASTEAK